jgi:Ca-activated chloride channel family protein
MKRLLWTLFCATLLLAPACADDQRPGPPIVGSESPAAAAPRSKPLALQPGLDIDPAVLKQPAAGPPLAGGGGGLDLDLGADRPALRVAVPRVKRATTASFSFGDRGQGWITRLPTGGHLPSVAYGNGRVYVSGGFNTHAFYALAAHDGRVEWHRQDLEDNGATAPLYLEPEGDVVFNTESCTLFVLDARTGRTRWHRWLGDPTLAQAAVDQGLIYAAYPAEGGGQRLAALRLGSGRFVWRRAVDSELFSAPVAAGGAVYATTVKGSVYRFDGRSGRRAWVRRMRASSAPWVAGGRVYLSRIARVDGRSHEAQVVLDAGTGRSLAILRQSPAPYHADIPRTLTSWPKVWAFEGSRPMLAHGRLLDTMAGVVHAAHPQTGRTLWRRSDPAAHRQRTLLPPVLAGSQVVVASRRGRVLALDIDTGMTVWAYDLGRRIASSPTVAHGWVYLCATDGSVIALNTKNPGTDGWHMWGGGPGHTGRSQS